MNAQDLQTAAETAALPAQARAAAKSAAGLIRASVSENTRRAYRSALARLNAFTEGQALTDPVLAAYVGHLEAAGRSPASAATAIAAARFRAKHAGGYPLHQKRVRGRGPALADLGTQRQARSFRARPGRHQRPDHCPAVQGAGRRRRRRRPDDGPLRARRAGDGANPPRLTRRGAPTAAVHLAGGWKTARMVAHYSAGVAAEDGAVARYL